MQKRAIFFPFTVTALPWGSFELGFSTGELNGDIVLKLSTSIPVGWYGNGTILE